MASDQVDVGSDFPAPRVDLLGALAEENDPPPATADGVERAFGIALQADGSANCRGMSTATVGAISSKPRSLHPQQKRESWPRQDIIEQSRSAPQPAQT